MIEVSGDEGIHKRFRSCLTPPRTHNLGGDRLEILGEKIGKHPIGMFQQVDQNELYTI